MSEERIMAGSEATAAGAPVLRVHGPSRLAFAGTTLALVTLASLATAALVSESTSVAPGTVSPGLQALPPLVTPGGDGVVVDRAPGTFTLTPARPVVAPAVRRVVDALGGGAEGSSSLPPGVSGGSGFPVTGVLRGTTGTPVTAPVTPPHTKPPVVHPVRVPSVEPSTVTKDVERAIKKAERAAKKAERQAAREQTKAAHGKKPKHEHARHDDRSSQQVEDLRIHEQAKRARHKHSH